MLKNAGRPLREEYDVAMLDLDGVVYIGPDAVPGAPQHLAEAAGAGLRLAYVTNNASRSPSTVARHLQELGVEVADEDVVTSAQAAARLLAERLEDGAAVFMIGGGGLEEALRERGLRPVQDPADDPAAVVSGFYADLRWSTVMAGAILVRQGLPWVASNTDLTVPTPAGPGPGNGALVEVVARFAGRTPEVAGKPEPPLFHETLRRVGGDHPLVVGDRLDTDVEGANRSGFDSLLVMTGVTGLTELVEAGPELRPSYVAADLGGLARPAPAPRLVDGTACAGPWTAAVHEGRLVVERTDGPRGADGMDGMDGRDGMDGMDGADGTSGAGGETGPAEVDDWWRAVAVAAWAHHDTTGDPVDTAGVVPPSSVGAARTRQPDQQTGDRQ